MSQFVGGTVGYAVGSILLAPVFILQGRRVRRVVARLPEAPGARSGREGSGTPLRVLVAGDSAAAGVGAPSVDVSLAGCLARDLAATHDVSWTLVARSGATAASTARHLAVRAPEPFDVAVLSVGLNDVTGRRPIDAWLADVSAIAAALRDRNGVRHLIFSGLPPMHLFPAFPQPLRWYLGATARRYDRALARWVSRQTDCEHAALELASLDGYLAPDGVHPGPPLYERWGEDLARRIRGRWPA